MRFPLANSHRLPRKSTLRIPFSSNPKQKHKKGSGATYLSGVTWQGYPKAKTGKGIVFRGGAIRKKRRRRKKKGGMSFSGSGINMSGGGVNFTGGAVNAAMRVVLNRFAHGKRVI